MVQILVGYFSLVLVRTHCWEFENVPIHVTFFQEKVTYDLFTNWPILPGGRGHSNVKGGIRLIQKFR